MRWKCNLHTSVIHCLCVLIPLGWRVGGKERAGIIYTEADILKQGSLKRLEGRLT